MWVALRPWPRKVTRAILQPFNVVVLGVSAILLAIDGAYDANTLLALGLVLPVGLIGSQIGMFVFRRTSDTRFRWLLITLMLASGLALLIREVL